MSSLPVSSTSTRTGILRRFYHTIAGTDQAFSFEHRIFNLSSFVVTVFSLQASIFNSILELHYVTILLGIVGCAIAMFTFYLSRIRRLFNHVLLTGFFVATICILGPLFFFNGASLGPTIYLMVMILTALLLITPSRLQALFCFIYAVLILSLLLLEYFYPHLVTPYTSNAQRIADYAISLLYTLFFTALVIWLFRRSYHREQQTIIQQKKELETLYNEAQEKNEYIQSLIRELHHRVKNNLQVVSSLMSLQSNRMEDEQAKMALEDGKTRVDAMALIHQKLYLDHELAAVNMQDYLEQLTASLAGSFGLHPSVVQTNVNLQQAAMNIDRAVSIGLITNELVTNAFKHAFNGIKNPRLLVQLEQKENKLQLVVADNGIGLKNKQQAENNFGLKLVDILVNQLDAAVEVSNHEGTRYLIQMEVEQV